jgi:hypothetical protein
MLRFTVKGEAIRAEVEEDVLLALFASECIFGKPRVRLEVSYRIQDQGQTCLLETAGEAGEAAACIFTGLLTVRYGETGYRVKRLVAAEVA